jgi:site-specific recombinase XerD
VDRFRLCLVTERGRSQLTTDSYASDLKHWLNFCEANGFAPFPPFSQPSALFANRWTKRVKNDPPGSVASRP